ncbi:MAG: Kelch repeat-containing protein [Planctomycetota bacterium]
MMRSVPERIGFQFHYCWLVFAVLAAVLVFSQASEASTWVSGANTVNQLGVYGTKGEPNADNVPGARDSSVSWIDDSGALWLFGGFAYDVHGFYGCINDLWRFEDPNWTWVSGANTVDQAGVYGTKGEADPANIPGARCNGVSWIDPNGNLWLFGGFGYDEISNPGSLNDLWKFDGSNWTWVSGDKRVDRSGTYGILGTPDPTNTPGGRDGCMAWTDAGGNLWLFGGFGYDGGGTLGYLNDLWKFQDPNWVWVKGSATVNQAGSYGTQAVPGTTNVPGARDSGGSGIDTGGDFWVFGGYGYDDNGDFGRLNDLWKFDGTDWMWVAGPNTSNVIGVYGTKGEPDPNNIPGARRKSASWMDGSDNLWVFGGHGYDTTTTLGRLNDLWKFDGANWTWVSGSSTLDQAGVYGPKGQHDSAYQPGARDVSVSWMDASGDLWLLGGYGHDKDATKGALNDLWKFERFCEKPPGDINLDCKFDLIDFALMAPYWLEDNWHY